LSSDPAWDKVAKFFIFDSERALRTLLDRVDHFRRRYATPSGRTPQEIAAAKAAIDRAKGRFDHLADIATGRAAPHPNDVRI
jgi:hypothetical protein